MARSVKDAKLETRTARLKLKRHKRHWKAISRGLALGYWRGAKSASWLVRKHLGNNKYTLDTLPGRPDDHEDADGDVVLDFYQAQDAARGLAKESRKSGPYIVRQAVADYLEAFEGKSRHETERMCERYIVSSSLADKPVAKLTAAEIKNWRGGLAKAKPRTRAKDGKTNYRPGPVDERARKATANRILTCLKAVLNHAWRDHKVPSDQAWRAVRAYKKVDAPRVRYLSADECRRLVNACAKDFRPLVQALLHTGCRYGEITRLEVKDYDSTAGTVYVQPSKGDARHVYLTDEGRRFFDREALNRPGAERLLLRADGAPWKGSQQARRFREASVRAKINPPATAHVTRHTYGAALARKGVSLQVIAEAMGHSNVEITRKYYAHLQPSYVEQTIRGALPEYGFDQEDNVTPIGGQA